MYSVFSYNNRCLCVCPTEDFTRPMTTRQLIQMITHKAISTDGKTLMLFYFKLRSHCSTLCYMLSEWHSLLLTRRVFSGDTLCAAIIFVCYTQHLSYTLLGFRVLSSECICFNYLLNLLKLFNHPKALNISQPFVSNSLDRMKKKTL